MQHQGTQHQGTQYQGTQYQGTQLERTKQGGQQDGATQRLGELREVVVEASLALARLDAGRLEEMALCCQALNRDLAPGSSEKGAELARQARDAAGEMRVFAGVLEATRANLGVMRHLRERHQGRLEYAAGPVRRGDWNPSEKAHGNH